MDFHRVEFRAMGSPCALHLYAEGADALETLAASCRAEIDRLERDVDARWRVQHDGRATEAEIDAVCGQGCDVLAVPEMIRQLHLTDSRAPGHFLPG